jgi:hypothetical protein
LIKRLKTSWFLIAILAAFLVSVLLLVIISFYLSQYLVKRLKTSWFSIASSQLSYQQGVKQQWCPVRASPLFRLTLTNHEQIISAVTLGALGVEELMVGLEHSTWLDLRDFCVASESHMA